MAPTLVREPFHRAGWIYEEKVDGWRIIAYKDRDSVRLVSRSGVDHSRRFRDIAAAISKLSARTLVLDGEVAVFDEQLRSARRVQGLQHVGHAAGPFRNGFQAVPYLAALRNEIVVRIDDQKGRAALVERHLHHRALGRPSR